MKYILPILFLSISFFNLKAQVAPDFTLTATDGTTQNLYTYLSQGKTVVIHFAATDCVECWDFHETQNMNLANNAYGAGGTDEMVFLLLETDTLTGIPELEGMGLYTEGDWTDGTLYPIIDGAENVAADYGVTDLPAVIAICAADTTITDLYTAGYPTVQDMYIAHNVCTTANTANDLTIIDIATEVFCGTLNPELLLLNTGTDTVTTATFIISTDAETETISWSGSIVPNEPTTLILGTGLTEATTEVTVTIEDVNDTPDGSSFTKTVVQAESHCVEQLVITVLTDDFGCETAWEINGPSGRLIGGNDNATAGNRAIEYDDLTGACVAPGYSNNTSYTVTYPPLDSMGVSQIVTGCYEFRILDDWGDGMCCGHGDGSYTIADQDGNVLATGGDFGAEEIVSLDIKLAVSGGTIVSPDIELCTSDTLTLETTSPILDPVRGLTNIAWGTWILDDPLGQSTIPEGGLPDDNIPTDDLNYVGYWQDVGGLAISGESVQILADTSNITYYIAPIITNDSIEFDTLCSGLNPAQGYTVSMNPVSCCKDIVSGGSIVSAELELCIDSTLILTTADPILDATNDLTNIVWGVWILDDPLNNTSIPEGELPDDQIPTDDVNFADYWLDANGQVISGDTIEISADTSGITYYIAPLITNDNIEFGTPCTGLDPSQGYTVFMNPLDSCKQFVDIELPIPTTSISISPNPALDYFNLNFDLKEPGQVSIYLHNIMGQEVKYLSPSHYSIGENTIQIETKNLPSGMYITTLQTEKGSISKKVTITKP